MRGANEEMTMTRIKLAAVLTIAIAAFAPPPAHASSAAPWCAVINQGRDVYWDCQYASFEQCYPTILAGNRGFCNENPAYTGPIAPPRKQPAPHKHPIQHD